MGDCVNDISIWFYDIVNAIQRPNASFSIYDSIWTLAFEVLLALAFTRMLRSVNHLHAMPITNGQFVEEREKDAINIRV